MATITIDIDKNEHELYDYMVSVNGEVLNFDTGYTSDANAEEAAREAIDAWRAERFNA